MADFIGFLKEYKIDRVMSETVRIEIGLALTSAVNRFVDHAHLEKAGQMRVRIRDKCRERLPGLRLRIHVRGKKGDKTEVERFYNDLLKNPESRTKLENLRDNKRKYDPSAGLMPEDSDMQILSDVIANRATDELVYLVSKDGHFTDFKNEIDERFSIKIIALSELERYKTELLPREA